MFIKITSTSDLPARNEAKEFACGERMICVANLEGEYYALDNECVHNGGPLGQGVVHDGKIVCPWHAWVYDLKTGEIAPGRPGVKAYALKVERSDVMVEL
jgi:nitrite reductase (NADH) small subunit